VASALTGVAGAVLAIEQVVVGGSQLALRRLAANVLQFVREWEAVSTASEFGRFSLVSFLLLAACFTACNKSQNQTAQNPPEQPATVTGTHLADGNLAPAAQYGTQQDQPPPVPPSGESYGQNYSHEQPVVASEPPPPLPNYDQPPVPGEDYIWTPGYWDYANDGYYWVPGAWVLAPWVGALWTPPWWGYEEGHYHLHSGYWGPHIGYYGGIDYGYGYTGRGYYGAYWSHERLDYNRAVTNVSSGSVHNIYNYQVPSHGHHPVSYNGGRGGTDARPTPQELAGAHEARTPPVTAQIQHARAASANRAQFAAPNGGHPATLTVAHPIPTAYRAPASRPPATATQAAQQPVVQRPAETKPAPRPGEQATRFPENRAILQQKQRPGALPQNRPATPVNTTQAPRATPAQQPERPTVPEARPRAGATAPASQAPQNRTETRPATPPRPAQQVRPEPPVHPALPARPEARPAPPSHPAPQSKEERKEH
jgi:hypothetical protein